MTRGARRERKGKGRQRPFSKAGKREKLAARLDEARFALRGGDPHRSFEVCRAVLADQPDNVEALSLAGVAAFHAGLAEDALGLLTLAVDHDPTHAESWTNLANLLVHRGRTDTAIETYQTAMAADPDYPESYFNFATLMESLGQLPQALQAYQKTLEKAADHEPARHGMGNVLKALGRLVEAKAVYEETLERSPSQPAVRANLAAVLHELGDPDGAAAQCRRALAAAPTLLEARYNLGLALQEQERFDEAIAAYEMVLGKVPDHAAAAHNRADALQRAGHLDEAREAYGQTITIDPDFTKPQVNLADLNLQLGDPVAALSVCDIFLSGHPGNTDLLAFKAIALGDAGRDREVERLIDFERLLHTVDIEPPPNYPSLDAFNEALVAHLLEHPTLTPSPLSHATRDGRHSGELLSEPRGPFTDFENVVREAVGAYRTNLGRDADHPFLAEPPERMDLSVWGVVMEAGGHQVPHIHPAAWMSGVYYAEIPAGISGEDRAGWLEFGRPPGHFHNRSEPPRRALRPKAGLMVLFPSYFYHHTIPFEMDQRRISIAFDLIPAQP